MKRKKKSWYEWRIKDWENLTGYNYLKKREAAIALEMMEESNRWSDGRKHKYKIIKVKVEEV